MNTTKTDRSLSQIFDVHPTTGNVITTQPIEIVTANVASPNVKLEDDFELARTMMHSLMLKGSNSLDNALLIAVGTEDPKAFDAVSKLISNMSDISEKLLGLHERKAKSSPASAAAPIASDNTTNISGPVFVGSTSELALMITNSRK